MNKREIVIKTYKEELRSFLKNELQENGGSYERWYADLEGFRKYIIDRYIKCKIGKQLYLYKVQKNDYGDYIDHHIVSYLAPLEYCRYGWSNNKHTASEQICLLSDYVRKKGKRFVVVTLPNKGFIYPQLICDNIALLNNKTMPAPQYRKFVYELTNTDTEVLDVYPVFKEWVDAHGNKDLLFSKDHHISSIGAKLIADTISNYILSSTEGIIGSADIRQEKLNFYDWSANSNAPSTLYMNYIMDGEKKEVLWKQLDSNKKITIFGDCNLQSYISVGGGIQANLAYNLQHPVYDAGRLLVFDDKREPDNRMSKIHLDALMDSDLIIYLAFSSASFVRSSEMSGWLAVIFRLIKERSLDNFKWASFEL